VAVREFAGREGFVRKQIEVTALAARAGDDGYSSVCVKFWEHLSQLSPRRSYEFRLSDVHIDDVQIAATNFRPLPETDTEVVSILIG